ncbi:hypothetical protein KQX54_015056 [Cotesia glomerata]|uniref:Uncharacterized protein n=1 Tax=Cotesia glomerata TaxID=32391 RepID=A0AAV7IT18_COTGL|nr:hypothetical protein KQX54_015056 [Cotesia glomerata]
MVQLSKESESILVGSLARCVVISALTIAKYSSITGSRSQNVGSDNELDPVFNVEGRVQGALLGLNHRPVNIPGIQEVLVKVNLESVQRLRPDTRGLKCSSTSTSTSGASANEYEQLSRQAHKS